MIARPYTVVLMVPTGVGARIGGYAGDALPVARAIAQVSDILITHPNVLNGAQLFWPMPNALYVEGFGLDQFAAGHWGLRPVHQNRMGLILDAGIEADLQLRHLQAADACRATLGLEISTSIVTDRPLGVELNIAPSGASWGTIAHPDSLLRAADTLIRKAGVNAIAVVARFPEDIPETLLQAYRQGNGVDPVAGAEAVISHLIVRQFQIPCAHAPAMSPPELDPHLAPRSAAEEIGYTFLPCVLAGLSRAPQFITSQTTGINGDIWHNQVDAVVVPASACGGSAILSLSGSAQIITIQENETQMQVFPEQLGIKALPVNSYLEAIGAIACHRAGISPHALRPHLAPLPSLKP